MKRLIVNADDFGFTRGVNAGIIRAFKEGILTSTTLMANGDAFDDAAALARANPALGVGCHLAAVGGKALSREVKNLATDDGSLPKTLTQLMMKLARGAVQSSDIEREFAAQVEHLIAAGIKPTHLDTHKHTAIHPTVMRAMARVANDFNIGCVRFPFENFAGAPKGEAARTGRTIYLKQRAVSLVSTATARQFKSVVRKHRLRTPDFFCGVALTGLLDREAVCNVIVSLQEGTTELMCHAGLDDEDLEHSPTRLKRQRQREFEALIDNQVKRQVEEQSVILISYGEF